MKLWATSIRAVCPVTGNVTLFQGPHIPAPTEKLAHEYCQLNGLGYCWIDGELIAEILAIDNVPDWSTEINYGNIQNN